MRIKSRDALIIEQFRGVSQSVILELWQKANGQSVVQSVWNSFSGQLLFALVYLRGDTVVNLSDVITALFVEIKILIQSIFVVIAAHVSSMSVSQLQQCSGKRVSVRCVEMDVSEIRFSSQFRGDVRSQRINTALMSETVKNRQQQIADYPDILQFAELIFVAPEDVARGVDAARINDRQVFVTATDRLGVKKNQRQQNWNHKSWLLMWNYRQGRYWDHEGRGHQALNALNTRKLQPSAFQSAERNKMYPYFKILVIAFFYKLQSNSHTASLLIMPILCTAFSAKKSTDFCSFTEEAMCKIVINEKSIFKLLCSFFFVTEENYAHTHFNHSAIKTILNMLTLRSKECSFTKTWLSVRGNKITV